MNAWIVIAAVGIGTYLFRASMFLLLGDRSLPTWTATPLALVAPSAIAALVFSMIFTDSGRIKLSGIAELLAVATAYVVTRRTGNVMHAIAVGLPVFWVAALVAR